MLLTDSVLNDRVFLSDESFAEVASVFTAAVLKYSKVYGFDEVDCAIESDPNDKIRILEGQTVRLFFYNNPQNHGVYGSVTYSKVTGGTETNFE